MARTRSALSDITNQENRIDRGKEELFKQNQSYQQLTTSLLIKSSDKKGKEFLKEGTTSHHSSPGQSFEKDFQLHSKHSSELPVLVFVVQPGDDWIDIDKDDKENIYFCSEYVEDIFKYYKQLEIQHRPTHNYLQAQSFITERHRRCCIDFIVHLHQHLSDTIRSSLQLDTLFLAVSLFDRFLCKRNVAQEKLPLLCVGCLFVACKFEETCYPSLDQMIRAVPSIGSSNDVLRIERIILSELRYSLGVPTAVTFLRRYAKAAQTSREEGMVARFICELSLMSGRLSLCCLPSQIASAALGLALSIIGKTPWTPTLVHYTGEGGRDSKDRKEQKEVSRTKETKDSKDLKEFSDTSQAKDLREERKIEESKLDDSFKKEQTSWDTENEKEKIEVVKRDQNSLSESVAESMEKSLHTESTFISFEERMSLMAALVRKCSTMKDQTIFKKYSQKKYLQAAIIANNSLS
ncbi:putative Cyclin [Monocercomonoides exilis]|uniref:putative Cyclin n=1 Tax=Monocercomonoides exilis TaxID=2049356 RepID=UPI00355944D1|nr:putative Cyclin [Monocercomonoides exilis]|eukprot:MONOS_9461.1-p1 / transcript=MONOS_9461.1 / gene=MONOS_9461 / organism=Monocercomonoides_exilis_PA203 / gene_product=Cyclin / transcript_product=Cyclin / location=Mono_scaffold00391:54351-55981(-) / protein_length=464 / sequence_SO=supercontig / SO=protein_coding / is_pseudo=false